MNIYDIIYKDNPSEILTKTEDKNVVLLFTRLISVIEDLEDRVKRLESNAESDNGHYY